VALNCWHACEYESTAMWRIYGENGFAIQSNYGKLKDSLPKEIYIGKVNYIDYEKDSFEYAESVLTPYFYKRKNFSYEKEIRAIIIEEINENKNSKMNKNEYGINVKVDLNKLIQNIYISPELPNWYYGLIKSIIEKYGYKFEIKKSSINNLPMF
jgi:hypothetical protein